MTNKDYSEEHEIIRKQLWRDIACAYVSAANSTNANGAAKWADKILEAFDDRFTKPEEHVEVRSE